MPGRRLNAPDLLFGAFLLALAFVALAATAGLRGGTAADMGPAYMPRAISLGLVGFGLWFVVRGITGPAATIPTVRFRPLLGILAAVAAFALLVTTAGLALAALATILVAALASDEARPVETLVFGGALAAASVALFVEALALPVPIWPW